MSDIRKNAFPRRAPRAGGLELSGGSLTIDEVNSVARAQRKLAVTDDPSVVDRMRASQRAVRQAVDNARRVYGITTGFGSMSEVPVPARVGGRFARKPVVILRRPVRDKSGRSPTCAGGHVIARQHVAERCFGCPAQEVVQRLVRLPERRCRTGCQRAWDPLEPAATSCRSRPSQACDHRARGRSSRVMMGDRCVDAEAAALNELGPRAAGIAAQGGSGDRQRYFILARRSQPTSIARVASAACGFVCGKRHDGSRFVGLTKSHSMPFVHDCKPHPGQIWSAAMIRNGCWQAMETPSGRTAEQPGRPHLQDCYSLRCLPQYMGPIVEGMAAHHAASWNEK